MLPREVRLLLVDDDPSAIQVMSRMLAQFRDQRFATSGGVPSPVRTAPDASPASRFGWQALKPRLAAVIARVFDEARHRRRHGSEPEVSGHRRSEAALIQSSALQNAIFNSANFSSIATDEKGVIQLFKIGRAHV